jgi:quercetin dioxygenase-like cupin family protein
MEVLPVAALERGPFSAELQGHAAGSPGVSVILVEAAPGDGPALHTHPYAEVLVVQEGTMELTDGTTTQEVGAGHVVVVAAGEPHAFRNVGPGVLRSVDIHVGDAFRTTWLGR